MFHVIENIRIITLPFLKTVKIEESNVNFQE